MKLPPFAALFAFALGCSSGSSGSPDAGVACPSAPPSLTAAFGEADCPVPRPAAPDTFDEALAIAGLDRCSLRYTAHDWRLFDDSLVHDPYRLPWYDAVHDHPAAAPAFARRITDALDQAADSSFPVTGALGLAAVALGASAPDCVPAFATDDKAPLARAVAQVIRDAGGTPDDAALAADAADVPVPLQQALAQVVLAASEANQAWRALEQPLSGNDLIDLGRVPSLTLRAEYPATRPNDPVVQSLLSQRFDEAALARGAVVLATRIERAGLSAFAGARGFDFEQETPIGRVVVRDAAAHTHEPGSHVLLLVDTGGDDTYHYPAGAVDATEDGEGLHHVGIAIDLQGKDHYGYPEVPDPQDGTRLPADEGGRYHPSQPVAMDDGPVSLSEKLRQGAARLGYGMLFDLGTEADSYRSLRMSQGYGAAGVGVLYDQGGDDLYEGEAAVQGSAHFGIGLLLDGSGNDRYRAYSQAQGFASVRAVGTLYDGSGDDDYHTDNGNPADGGDPLYWSIQTPGKGNKSFSQGSAWGRRSPGTAGDSADMSGGLGVLRDRRGTDRYETSVQGQGAGYWFGTGLLADGGGNDTYDARYYMQGSGAHFAMALFIEEGGDDRYNLKFAPTATSIGVGHDYTVSWHLDLGGNDEYRAPLLSLGSGNANGIGILVNAGGDDIYHAASEPTLGAANLSGDVDMDALRRSVKTIGIFVDVGGHDVYDVTSTVTRGDDTTWSNPREPADAGITTERSGGVDRADGSVSF